MGGRLHPDDLSWWPTKKVECLLYLIRYTRLGLKIQINNVFEKKSIKLARFALSCIIRVFSRHSCLQSKSSLLAKELRYSFLTKFRGMTLVSKVKKKTFFEGEPFYTPKTKKQVMDCLVHYILLIRHCWLIYKFAQLSFIL